MRLDDLYPGWDGLDAGSAAVASILTTLAWRAWDWAAGAPGAWHELDASEPIVVEGVGAISRASRPLVVAAVWVELDDARRRQRALARDGDAYAPFWDRWAAQELAFVAREHPKALATLVVDGSDTTAILDDVTRAVRSIGRPA